MNFRVLPSYPSEAHDPNARSPAEEPPMNRPTPTPPSRGTDKMPNAERMSPPGRGALPLN